MVSKLVFFVTILVIGFSACVEERNAFVDGIYLEPAQYQAEYTGELNEELFNSIITQTQLVYDEIISEKGLKPLKITGHWNSKIVNAYMKEQLQINLVDVSGALARRDEITPAGFALILCHEIGHAYGGKPEKRAPLFLASVEGQADYYAAGHCFEKIIHAVPESDKVELTEFVRESCADHRSPSICERTLLAGQSAANLLSTLKGQAISNYETPDATVVRKTLKSYPKTVQCRLDTYYRAVLGQPRPRCWYKG